VAALNRAIALAQVDDVAVRVGQELHFDMPGILEVALDVDGRIREVGVPLTPCGLESALDVVALTDDAKALSPAARGGLDRERPAELVAEPDDLGRSCDRLGRSRDDRDAGSLHPLTRLRLRPHRLDRVRRRPDPREAGGLDRAGEDGILGEEPVAGVDGLGSGLQRRLDDLLLVQVALDRRPGAEQPGLVRHTNVEGGAIGLGVDGHRGDLQLAQRPEDADGDFPPVGNEDFREGTHERDVFSTE
jgi:hypothetical protein